MIDLRFTPTAKPGGKEREKEGREQDKRLSGKRVQLGKRKGEISSMCDSLTTSRHSSSVVSARLFLHRSTVGLSEYIKTARETESERKTDGESNSVFLERNHQLPVLLSLSFIYLCAI